MSKPEHSRGPSAAMGGVVACVRGGLLAVAIYGDGAKNRARAYTSVPLHPLSGARMAA